MVWEQCAALGWVLTADPSPWELAAVPQQPPESTSLLAVQIAVQIPFSALGTMLSPPSSQTPRAQHHPTLSLGWGLLGTLQ